MDEVKSAARRLLKSRLRRHLAETLGTERREESWSAVAEVEKGISEEAWAHWVKVRSAHAGHGLSLIVLEALQEASSDVRSTFEGLANSEWVNSQIRSFGDTFKVGELLDEEG